jgi:hypothetical protein
MHRSLPMKFRCLSLLLVATGLAAASAVAGACPDSKDSGVSATIPSAEPEIVLAANTNQETVSDAPALGPSSPHARFREADHLVEHPMSWLFITSGSGPKSGAHLSGAERMSHPVEHKASVPIDTHVARPGTRRVVSRPIMGDYESHVAKPHRMPGPEIL